MIRVDDLGPLSAMISAKIIFWSFFLDDLGIFWKKKCHVTRRETGHQQHGRRTKVFFNNLKNKGYPRTGTAIIARPGSPGRREEGRRRDFWPFFRQKI